VRPALRIQVSPPRREHAVSAVDMKSAASLILKLDTSRARGKQLLTHRNGGFAKADTDVNTFLPHKVGIEDICVISEFERKPWRQSLVARKLQLRAVFGKVTDKTQEMLFLTDAISNHREKKRLVARHSAA
jgi:hypothetical protein